MSLELNGKKYKLIKDYRNGYEEEQIKEKIS